MDPLLPSFDYGDSRSLISELDSRLPHVGPIFKNDNATVYVDVEIAGRGTSTESIIKSFSRNKDGFGVFKL